MPLEAWFPLARLVIPGLWWGDRSRPEVALTFDDGPHGVHTPALMDALDELGIVASFFWLGDALRREPTVARRVSDAGHQIGLHGATHRAFWGRRDEDVRRELDDLRKRVEDVTGRSPEGLRFVRPPFGRVLPLQARRIESWGYRLVFCDILPGDWEVGPEEVERRVARRLAPGSLVALHDGAYGKPEPAENVKRVAGLVGARGLECVSVEALNRTS